MGGTVDVVFQRMIANHVRIVNLNPLVSLGSSRAAQGGTHKDGPQVDKGEESDEEVLVDGDEVHAEVIRDRLEVSVDRVERVRCERRGN